MRYHATCIDAAFKNKFGQFKKLKKQEPTRLGKSSKSPVEEDVLSTW